jgi:hypothetical protein
MLFLWILKNSQRCKTSCQTSELEHLTFGNLVTAGDHSVHLLCDHALLLVLDTISHLTLLIGILDIGSEETWVDGVHYLKRVGELRVLEWKSPGGSHLTLNK